MRNPKPKLSGIPIGVNRLKIPVSIVKGVKSNDIAKYITMEAVINQMQSDDALKSFTKELREARQSDKAKYSKLKETSCPGFIIGKFEKRLDSACSIYVPLLGFDIDGTEDEFQTSLILADCRKIPFIFSAFPSPGGCGLRILIWCNSTPETNKIYYSVVCNKLSEALHIKTDKVLKDELKKEGFSQKEILSKLKDSTHIDTGTNNLSRVWFYSHVPKDEVFINLDSEVYIIAKEERLGKPLLPPTGNDTLPLEEKIRICELMVNNRNIQPGRNNYVIALACLMWEHGINKNDIHAHCLRYEEKDFNKAEITKTVESAIKRATFHKFSDKQLMSYKAKIEIPEDNTKTNEVAVDSDKPQRQSKFLQIKNSISRKYDFKLNTISNEIEYRLKSENEYKELNENDLIIELLEAGFSGVENPLIALLKSSFVPKHDPIKKYFEELPEWNETQPDFINQLAEYVNATEQDWFNLQFKKHLVRSVACALDLIPFNKHCFTLVGKQNDGKTSFLRFLCPPALSAYIKENLDIHNKDGRMALCQNFYINLDELANFSKYDINKTKAFFTIDKVKERLPYDRKSSNFSRRASFMASTNSSEFLTDETGNVRWLVFEINGIYHDNGGNQGYNQNIDIDLVYSQVYALLKSGYNFKLTPDEIAKSELNNKGFQITTTEEEMIQDLYKPGTENDHDDFLTATDILNILLVETKDKINRRNIGRAMTSLGFDLKPKFFKERNGKICNYQIKGYFVKKIIEKSP